MSQSSQPGSTHSPIRPSTMTNFLLTQVREQSILRALHSTRPFSRNSTGIDPNLFINFLSPKPSKASRLPINTHYAEKSIIAIVGILLVFIGTDLRPLGITLPPTPVDYRVIGLFWATDFHYGGYRDSPISVSSSSQKKNTPYISTSVIGNIFVDLFNCPLRLHYLP